MARASASNNPKDNSHKQILNTIVKPQQTRGLQAPSFYPPRYTPTPPQQYTFTPPLTILTPLYLFKVDHLWFGRVRERLLGNWDIFLNVLNVEAEDGITGLDFRRELYGEPEVGDEFDPTVSSLYVQVLRPLCWTGLLHEQRQDGFRLSTSFFTKTLLWRAALQLKTDDLVKPAVRH